jgi:hypothetical protein
VIAGNAAWMLASIALLFSCRSRLTSNPIGEILVAAQAIATDIFHRTALEVGH